MKAVDNWQPRDACVCGEPTTSGVVHRTDGPCYIDVGRYQRQSDVVTWVGAVLILLALFAVGLFAGWLVLRHG